MMPIKKILAERHATPRPPVLVIDETTIKLTEDAGPVCGCDEKYDLIKRYKPFTFGGVHPYNRRKIPDSECFKICWMKLKIGTKDFIFEKPIALHEAEIPKDFVIPRLPFVEDFQMLIRQPKYTEGYLLEKLLDCERQSQGRGCYCRKK